MSEKKMDKETKKEKVKFTARVNDFLRKYRKAFLGASAIVILAVVGLGVFSFVRQTISNKAAASFDQLEKNFQAWSDETVDATKLTTGDAVVLEADTLVSRYPSSYSAQKAMLLKAKIFTDRKDYKNAEAAYLALVAAYPKSHMATTALMNAASMAEESGQKENALALLQRMETEYGENSVGINRALFNIGRIYEELKQYDNASSAYMKLIAKATNDDWTKLAHDRIIYLRSSALVK